MNEVRGLAASRRRLVRAMCRFDQRLVERVVLDGALTDSDQRRGEQLAAERDWPNVLRRMRSR